MFKKNLGALKKVNPNLSQWLSKKHDQDWFTLIRSKNGAANFLINQKKIPGHNIENPQKEAFDSLGTINYHKDEATIIFGMGLGYLPAEIVKKCENGHIVIVIEPEPSIIVEALKIHDFSTHISSGKFFIATPGETEILTVLAMVESTNVIANWLMIASGYTTQKPDLYYELYQYTMNAVNQMQCNTGTVSGAGSQLAENDISTLPYIIKYRGIKDIFNLYNGKPAIIVSTGPSLSKNIHLLKDIQDKVIIICVGQALRILLAYDIRPDFACTVDYGKVNESHFDGLWNCDVPLVALNRTYAPILKKYCGPKFIVGTQLAGFKNSSSSIIEKKGFLPQGGSVAHLALGLAIKLGCNNIAMIGQDLSYSGDLSHNPNADSSGTLSVNNGILYWKVTDPKSHLYNKSFSMGIAKYVPGFWGDEVLTNLGLASFIHSFENIVKAHNSNFINCTEGGAHIKGTKRDVLSNFIKIYCRKKINKLIINKFLDHDPTHIKMMNQARDSMAKEIENYKNLILSANKAIKAAKKISSKGANKGKLLAENEKFSLEAENIAKDNPLLSVAIFNESRLIQSRKYTVNGKASHLLKNKNDLSTRIERNKIILKSAIDQAEKLLKITNESLSVVIDYLNGHDRTIVNLPEFQINPVQMQSYLDNNNFANPILNIRGYEKQNGPSIDTNQIMYAAEQMREKAIIDGKKYQVEKDWAIEIEYICLVDEAHEAGKKLSKMNKNESKKVLINIEKLLSRATKLKPLEFRGLWGLATTKNHIGKIKESLSLYEKILKSNNDISIKFEYANVMLRHDIKKALILFKEIFEETEKYDYFFSRIGDIYFMAKDYKKAIAMYLEYLKKFESDIKAWEKLYDIYCKIDDESGIAKCKKIISTLNH